MALLDHKCGHRMTQRTRVDLHCSECEVSCGSGLFQNFRIEQLHRNQLLQRRNFCAPLCCTTIESGEGGGARSSGSPSDAVIDIQSSGEAPKDTAGTLLVEGPAFSFGSSTGCGAQEERWSPRVGSLEGLPPL